MTNPCVYAAPVLFLYFQPLQSLAFTPIAAMSYLIATVSAPHLRLCNFISDNLIKETGNARREAVNAEGDSHVALILNGNN